VLHHGVSQRREAGTHWNGWLLASVIYGLFILDRALPTLPLFCRDGLFLLIIALILVSVKRVGQGIIALQWPRPRWFPLVGVGLGLGVGLFWIQSYQVVAHNPSAWLSIQAEGVRLIVADRQVIYPVPIYLAVTVIAAANEELLFRGLLQGLFERRLGPLPAFVGQGALFVLAHLLAQDGLPSLSITTTPLAYWSNLLTTSCALFAGALMMGWLRVRSQSLLPSFLFHSVHNLVVICYGLWFLPPA